MAVRTPFPVPDKNPMMSVIDMIAARAGVADTKVVTDVRSVARDVLDTRGHQTANVVEFRWGRLVVEAPATAAALLRYDTDVMLDRIETAAPGEVTELVVRTAR